MDPLSNWPNRTPVLQGPDPSPKWQLWLSALVKFVNGLLTTSDATTAAIAALQPVYGTWTPTDASGAGLVLTTPLSGLSNIYLKTSRLVLLAGSASYPVTADGSAAQVGGVPFPIANGFFAGPIGTDSTAVMMQANQNGSTLYPILQTGGTVTNATLSGKFLYFSLSYEAST